MLKILEYRVDELEKSIDDHERRLKPLEVMAIKLSVYFTLGSLASGVLTALLVHYLTKQG